MKVAHIGSGNESNFFVERIQAELATLRFMKYEVTPELEFNGVVRKSYTSIQPIKNTTEFFKKRGTNYTPPKKKRK